jgi:hypothetical protein
MSRTGYVFESHGRYDRKKHVVRSLCSQCGVREHPKGFKRLYMHGTWFRGEDEQLGIYCRDCAQKFIEEHSQEMK